MKPNFYLFFDLVWAGGMTFAAIAVADNRLASAFWGAQAMMWLCLFIWQVWELITDATIEESMK